MEGKKGLCETCPYWKHTPEAAQSARDVLKNALANKINGEPVKIQVGLCYYTRPNVAQVMTQGTLGQTQVQMARVFPQMEAGEFCADHPDRAIEREYKYEVARVRAAQDTVQYDTAKNPETGFNKPPPLAAALKLAVVADGRGECDCPAGI